MKQDKRDSKRLPTSAPIRYQKKGSRVFGNTIGRDVSDNGIGFISNEFLPISSNLIFEIQHPEKAGFTRAVGEVVWISSQPYSERFSVGAKFIEPPANI